jgi:aspartyl-tRNA(Asn)/glutamyl-tRNA(Gln) amidotransferase subunit C
MSLDKATVARIARLARIKVPAEETEALAADLSRILAFVEQLNELDCKDVPPMTSGGVAGGRTMKLRRRPDQVTDGNLQERVLANAPQAQDGYFAVPKVVE